MHDYCIKFCKTINPKNSSIEFYYNSNQYPFVVINGIPADIIGSDYNNFDLSDDQFITSFSAVTSTEDYYDTCYQEFDDNMKAMMLLVRLEFLKVVIEFTIHAQ